MAKRTPCSVQLLGMGAFKGTLYAALHIILCLVHEARMEPLPARYGPTYFYSGTVEPEDTPLGHIQYLSIPFTSPHCNNQTVVAFFHFKCLIEQEGMQSWRGFAFFQDGSGVEHIWKKRTPVHPACAARDVLRPVMRNIATNQNYTLHVHYGDSHEAPFTPYTFLATIPNNESVYEFYMYEGAPFYALLQPDCPRSNSTTGPREFAVMHSYPPYFKDIDLLAHALQSHMYYHFRLGFSKYVLNMYPQFTKGLLRMPFYRELFNNGSLVFGYQHPLTMTGEFFPMMFQMNQAHYTNLVVLEYWGTNTFLYSVDLDDYMLLHSSNSVQDLMDTCFKGAYAVTSNNGWTYLIGNDVNENLEWKNSSSAFRKYLYRTTARSTKSKVLAHPDCILSLRVHTPTVMPEARCRLHQNPKCFQRAHLENMFSSRAHVPENTISYVGEWFAKVVGSNADVGYVPYNVTPPAQPSPSPAAGPSPAGPGAAPSAPSVNATLGDDNYTASILGNDIRRRQAVRLRRRVLRLR